MYLACMPLGMSNKSRTHQLMIASNNLRMAQLTKRYERGDKGIFKSSVADWLPYPGSATPKLEKSKEVGTPLVTERFLQVVKELLETVRVLQKDIDRHGYLFRAVCTDAAQGLREGGERVIREIRDITGAVASVTTPLQRTSVEQSTEMAPPRATPEPRPTSTPVARRPLSVIKKPKK